MLLLFLDLFFYCLLFPELYLLFLELLSFLGLKLQLSEFDKALFLLLSLDALLLHPDKLA